MSPRARTRAHAGGDGPEGRAPAEHENLGVARLVVDLERAEVAGNAVDLGLAEADHPLVVDRVVGDVPRTVRLLEAADAVL